MIVAASGWTGSNRNVIPSSGLASKRPAPGDHREHHRLAERARRREHQGGDDRRARGAHRDAPDRAPAVDAQRRPTPHARRPGTDSSAVAVIATMIGRIITVRISDRGHQVCAAELHHVGHRVLARVADQVVVDPGRDGEDPDQAVDHRRHPGQQPDDRIEDPPYAGRARIRSGRSAASVETTSAITTASAGRDDRAPDQRPGAEVVEGVSRERASLRASPGTASRRRRRVRTSARPLCRERRPRVDQDGEDHRPPRRRRQATPIAAEQRPPSRLSRARAPPSGGARDRRPRAARGCSGSRSTRS